jgi:hypothetical protein
MNLDRDREHSNIRLHYRWPAWYHCAGVTGIPATPEILVEEVDPNERPTPRCGRNDPCWCGSGKKYKRCHLVDDLKSK